MALVHVFQRAPLKYSPAAVRGAAGSHQGAGSEGVLMYVLSNKSTALAALQLVTPMSTLQKVL